MNEESACKNMILFDLILGPFGVMEIHSELENESGRSLDGRPSFDQKWTVDKNWTDQKDRRKLWIVHVLISRPSIFIHGLLNRPV